MNKLIALGLILLLTGCGGYHQAKKNRGKPQPQTISRPIAITPGARPISNTATTASASKPFATGPIHSACMSSDRKARSRSLCGCIQAVADQTLSSGQQARAVRFYSDPHSAQEVRTSDRPADEKFWEAYSGYAGRAKRTCR